MNTGNPDKRIRIKKRSAYLFILIVMCGIILPFMPVSAGKVETTKLTESKKKVAGQTTESEKEAARQITANEKKVTSQITEGKKKAKMQKTAKTETTEQKIVRIASPEQEGMSFISKSGKVTGYNYDYLSKVSEYTGWKLSYTFYYGNNPSDNVMNAMEDVKNGKADLIGPILKSEQTEQLYEFPKNSYGTVYTTLCASNSGGIRENNIKGKKLLKVGLMEKAETRNQEVVNYLKSENFTYKLFYYDTSDEQEQALKEGKVDVISSVSLAPLANTRIVEKFSARPYYFVSTKGNKELIQELDDTIEKVNKVEPKLQEDLFEKYFHSSEDTFYLTQQQKDTLDSMKKIKVLCVDKDAPFVYQEKGKPKGALISLLNDFGEEVGLKIEYTFCESRDEAEKILEDKHYDILIGAPFPSDYCAKKGFIKTESIFESALAFVQNTSNTKRNSVAVVRGLERYINTASYSNVMICDNAEEAITAVNDKKVDFAAGDRSIMEYYIYDTDSALTTSLITGGTQNIRMAVSRDCSVDFLTVLNNYIYSLPDLNKTLYLSDGNKHSNSATLTHYVRTHPVEATIIVVVLTTIAAAGVFMVLYARQMSRKNEELRRANEVKSEFLTRMSHDIRTPINGILGMLEIADKYAEHPTEVRKYHKKIQVASGYLLSLVNNVLDMNKIETSTIDLKENSVYLHELIDSCVEIVRGQAEESKITLLSEGLHDFYPPRVFSNERCLQRIFINIIENAIKYNKDNGTIKIDAKVLEQNEENITCQFKVVDTGIGMSEEFQNRMFEAFEQENNDAKKIPIIALTANAFVGEEKKAKQSGMDAFITKPFTLDKLKESMASVRKCSLRKM